MPGDFHLLNRRVLEKHEKKDSKKKKKITTKKKQNKKTHQKTIKYKVTVTERTGELIGSS